MFLKCFLHQSRCLDKSGHVYCSCLKLINSWKKGEKKRSCASISSICSPLQHLIELWKKKQQKKKNLWTQSRSWLVKWRVWPHCKPTSDMMKFLSHLTLPFPVSLVRSPSQFISLSFSAALLFYLFFFLCSSLPLCHCLSSLEVISSFFLSIGRRDLSEVLESQSCLHGKGQWKPF